MGRGTAGKFEGSGGQAVQAVLAVLAAQSSSKQLKQLKQLTLKQLKQLKQLNQLKQAQVGNTAGARSLPRSAAPVGGVDGKWANRAQDRIAQRVNQPISIR